MERLLPMTAGDKEQLEFVCRMLSELELVSSRDGHLVARPEAMARFCAGSAPERHQAVALAYLSLQDWAELDVLLRTDARLVLQRSTHAPLSFSHFRSQLVVVRQMILRFLSTAGQDSWCRYSDIEAALQRLWHTFYPVLENQEWLTRSPVQAWHLAWQQEQRPPFARLATGSESNSHPNWQAVQGVVWRLMLEKPLRWLGLAELWQEGREVVAFRLRGLADLLWDRPAVLPLVGSEALKPSRALKGANDARDAVAVPAEQQSPGAITLRDSDTTIDVHPGLVSLSVLIFLGSIANLEQASAHRFTYRLSMREVHAAFVKGKSLSDLLAEWEDSVALPMPDSIRRALSGWWAAYGQVHLYEGLALLELREGITLDELEASTALGQYMLARLSERLVVVPEGRVDDLLREFTAKGHTPKEVR
jgi:hypothetical protein